MNSFLFQLKEQVTLANALVLLLVAAIIFYRYKKKKTAKFILATTLIFFLLTSTYYLPHYLATKLEQQYPPLPDSSIKKIKGKVFIHVLGSGYTPGKNIPPNAQICLVALGRLAEGIRVYRLLDSATIVCSGSSPFKKTESQAQVTKNAAVALGIPANDIATLNTPATTMEEATELAKQYGKNITLVIATDALHIPRAIRFFKAVGFSNPIAAPTNFRAAETEDGHSIRWLPSIENITLANLVLHEYLGNLKAVFVK